MKAMVPGVVSLLLSLLTVPPATAADLQIFDAHIHYSRPDWSAVPTERALAILTEAGVRRAIVSSTPDDRTMKLYEAAPSRIVPFLRPYRTRDDMSTWSRDPAVAAYVEERLTRGVYRGIGEFHMSADEADAPVVKRFAELATQLGIYLHAHVDETAVERLATLYPKARILWAHAGMSASAPTVGRLLDRFPNLWVELAIRTDVAPGGRLDPAWAAVMTRHADRFMVGTDTWVTSRWDSVVGGMRDVRTWLGQLPAEVAEKIAWRNGERLFAATADGKPAGAGERHTPNR